MIDASKIRKKGRTSKKIAAARQRNAKLKLQRDERNRKARDKRAMHLAEAVDDARSGKNSHVAPPPNPERAAKKRRTSGGRNFKRKPTRIYTAEGFAALLRKARKRKNYTTEERKTQLLEAYIQLGTVTGACRIADVSYSTHYDWLDTDPEYRARFEESHEAAVDLAEQELRRRGVNGTDKPVFYKGDVVATVREYSDACLIFYLKGRRGDIFRERTEIGGLGGGPIQMDLTKLPDDRLQLLRQWMMEAQQQLQLDEAKESNTVEATVTKSEKA